MHLRRLFGWGFTTVKIRLNPPVLLMVLYAILIALGAAVLMLPAATTQPITWSDAIFTATSAVTVTGLVVIDTGSALTPLGQGVVMVLIQLGGLGLMAFAVLVLSLLGMPVGLNQQLILRDDLDQTSVRNLMKLVRMIFTVVLGCETVGFVVLAIDFVPEFGWRHGLWTSLFHTISAFNNAGFSLYPDSLTAWAGDPAINIIIPVLFITGGLGYVVLSDLLSGRKWRAWSLHTKLMLAGTAGLIVLSTALFAILEWDNPATLGGMDSMADRLWASWFQGVTTRTAGFNTVDISSLKDSTSLMMMSMMFIGGGSTSTAGGIKVTTAIVMVLAVAAFFKRRQTLVAFRRSIGHEEVLKVMALVTIAVLFVITGTFVITVMHDNDFIDVAFEVVSAFGTVGLSRGLTGELDTVGRTVICIIMFFGRVGPLTLGFFLATRVAPRIRHPDGKIFLG